MHYSLHVYMFHDCMCGKTILERLMGKGEGVGKKKRVRKRKEKRDVHSGVVIIEAQRDST